MRSKKTCFILLFAMLGFLGLGNAYAQNVTPQKGDKITTDDGVYVVSGDNLISNPSFDDGFTGWKAGNGSDLLADNFEVVATGGADNGAYLHALGSAGSSTANSIKTGWAVQTGKMYLFSCWSYRTSDRITSNTQYSRIYVGDTETATTTQIGTVNYIADTWAQTQIVFTAENLYLVANLGWLNQSSFDCFFLGEITLSDELVTEKLATEIAEAKELLSTTTEGTARGEYPTAVRSTLQAAIDAAQSVVDNATTQDEINEAFTVLETAIATYKSSAVPPFETGKQYCIVHNSGYYMSTGGGTVKIVEADVADQTQVLEFVVAPEGAEATGYNIKDAQGNYIYRSDSWNTFSSSTTSLTAANAIFQIVDYGTYIQVKNMGSGSVLGTDSGADQAIVYSNKNGSAANNCWTIIDYIPADQRDDKYNFEELLGKAQKTISGISESSIGTSLFMVSRSAYDAFSSAISTAEGMTDYASAIDYLQAAMDLFAANQQNKPEADKVYTITQQSSGNNIAYDATQTVVVSHTVSAETTQQFSFVAASTEGAYSFKNVSSSLYIAKNSSSGWNTTWNEDNTANESQWYISAVSSGVYTLQNVAGKGYLGSDATTDGAILYCDKSASAANSLWIIEEYSVTGALTKTIENAKELAANTTVGTAYYEVPQSAMDELNAAIGVAETALPTITTFEAGKTAADALQTAIETFNASFNPLNAFDTSLTYTITHYGGNLLTATESGNATITIQEEEGASNNQLVTLETAPNDTLDNVYYLKSVGLNTYFARTGDYNTQWQANVDSAAVIQIVKLEGQYLGLKFISTNTYSGTDLATSGSSVYSDKSGAGNSMNYWLIESYAVVLLDRVAFNAAASKADSVASTMISGYKIGQYLAEDVAAFKQAISNARSNASKVMSQEALDAITVQLLADIDTYKAKVLTEDIINRNLLEAAITKATTATNNAVAGDCDGQYPADAITAYKNALSDAQAVENNTEATQDEIDAATTALAQAAATFAAAVVKIDYTNLTKAIADAQQQISAAEAYKGEGAGKYPESAFTALQAVVDEAQQMKKDNNGNQAAVNVKTEQLLAAITVFSNARTPNDYATLQEYVDLATKLLADCDAALYTYDQTDYDDMKSSLNTYSLLLSSTDQDEIDKAAKALRRDVLLFQSLITSTAIHFIDANGKFSINNIPQGANVSIFDNNGRLLSNSPKEIKFEKGLYIVKITTGKETVIKKVIVK